MSSDHRFEILPEQGESPKRSKWASCLIGCLVAAGITLVIIVVAGIWVARNFRGWAADFGSQAINQGVDSSDLAPQEKIEVKQQVDRVGKAFRDGRITVEQAGTIVQKVMQSPLMPILVVGAVDKHYFARSGLSDDEKKEGRLTLKRLARGVIDKKIDEKGLDKVMSHVADRQSNGSWQLRPQVTDDELRAALAAAKTDADDAGIAAQPENIDVSDELKKIIDESMPVGE